MSVLLCPAAEASLLVYVSMEGGTPEVVAALGARVLVAVVVILCASAIRKSLPLDGLQAQDVSCQAVPRLYVPDKANSLAILQGPLQQVKRC